MTDRARLLALAVALVVSLAPAAAETQDPPGAGAPNAEEPKAGQPSAEEPSADSPVGDARFSERIDVAVVEVDVWVTGPDGNPVTGLAASDLSVRYDGRPVTLSYFSEVRGGRVVAPSATDEPSVAAAPDSPAGEPFASDPALVLYFDRLHLQLDSLKLAARGLGELVADEGLRPERILILSQGSGLSVEAPFGSSVDDLRAAVERLGQSTSAGGIDLDAETERTLDAIRDAWERSQDTAGSASAGIATIPDASGGGGPPGSGGGSPRAVVGGVGGSGGPDACGMFVNEVEPILDGWARARGRRVETTLSNLSNAAGFLAGLPGVKTLVYVGDGLSTRPGTELATFAGNLCPSATTELMTSASTEELSQQFLEVTRHANSNRVTIHTLQASGLRSPGAGRATSRGFGRGGAGTQRTSAGFEASQRATELSGLTLLADETGGRTVYNRNELGPDLARISQDARSYYSLAFEAPAAAVGSERGHRIEVETSDDSWEARYRRSYEDQGPRRRLAERTEGALNLGITSNPLGLRLGLGAIEETPGGTHRLQLHVLTPVDRLGFRQTGTEWFAELAVQVLARSVGNGALASHEQSFRVQGAPGGEGLADLPVSLTVGDGTHLAAIGVLDRESGQISYITTVLDTEAGD